MSLALNQGYGWAGDVNLKFIFERLFSVEWGSGFPKERREPQEKARNTLSLISSASHKSWAEIIKNLPVEIVADSLAFGPFKDLLDITGPMDPEIQAALLKK